MVVELQLFDVVDVSFARTQAARAVSVDLRLRGGGMGDLAARPGRTRGTLAVHAGEERDDDE